LVGALSLSPVPYTIGLYLFIPTLLMVAAAWAFLYLPVLALPLAAYRAGLRPVGVLAMATLGLAPALWLPLASNAVAAMSQASLSRDDLAPAEPAPVPTNLNVAASANRDVVESLLASGSIDHVLYGAPNLKNGHVKTGALSYLVQGGGCGKPFGPDKDFCRKYVDIRGFDVDGILEVKSGLSPLPYHRVSYSRCTPDCVLISRQTVVEHRNLSLPLRLVEVIEGPTARLAIARKSKTRAPSVEALVANALDVAGAPGRPRPSFDPSALLAASREAGEREYRASLARSESIRRQSALGPTAAEAAALDQACRERRKPGDTTVCASFRRATPE
jgi:hypothetical protein